MLQVLRYNALIFLLFYISPLYEGAERKGRVLDTIRIISKNLVNIFDENAKDDLVKKIRFVLFTRHRLEGEELSGHFSINSTKPVKFLVHGWFTNKNVYWYPNTTKALLEKGDYNVIQTDWSNLAISTYYVGVKKNAKLTGRKIGDFIVKLKKTHKVPLSRIQIIGHSLGSHVAGFAGKAVREMTGSKIRAITSLDAAGPLFDSPEVFPEDRLSDGDAEIVENLHTDGSIFGYQKPIGTVDYYPYGGKIQPACKFLRTIRFDSLMPNCNHKKSVEYYIHALKEGGIPATKCESWNLYETGMCEGNDVIYFGDDISPKSRGSYFFEVFDVVESYVTEE